MVEIRITSGSGKGPTELSAFDEALHDAGIANYNLIKMSSIIPPDSNIYLEDFNPDDEEYGNKLYVVMIKCIKSKEGESAWAGLGWKTNKNTGKGFFVEHDGSSKNEVNELISNSLENLENKRNGEYSGLNSKTEGIKCRGEPVCSVVAAIYKSEGWENGS